MLFNSFEFLIFFPIVIFVYHFVPDRFRHIWLLLCSYYFYMCWNARYVLLIFASTLITYVSGRFIEEAEERKDAKRKKIVLFFCIIVNLSILFAYKYLNFALDLLAKLFAVFHVGLHVPVFDIILPVGISFYTFQALIYTIDVYRGDIKAEKDFLRYALFVSFFPQLVAGPIERSGHLLGQLASLKKIDYEKAKDGFLLMLWGFFLKIVIADRLAIFVNAVYNDYTKYPGFLLVMATAFFAIQIYCDFYGYSTIAVGAAKILGVDLMENFRSPYLSVSVAEFWRNWHISLTSWFRDYLYIPLGGNRKGKFRKYLNILIVFLVSGLWHGADLTYVIWGLLNGLYQVIGELLKPLRNKVIAILHINRENLLYRLFAMAVTFTLVSFSWIFFRAADMKEAIGIITSICTVHNMFSVIAERTFYWIELGFWEFWFAVLCIMILFAADLCKKKKIVLRNLISAMPMVWRCAFIAFIICAILLFGVWGPAFDEAQFIYFQF